MISTIPGWLHTLSIVMIAIALLCALVIVTDILAGHRQHMWIMNIVWPVTALWAGPLALVAYFTLGRKTTHGAMREAKRRDMEPPGKRRPFPFSVGLGAMHCGAGCTLGDLVAESFVIAVPISLFGSGVAGTWTLDFFLAFLFGVGFQYFTIAPMRGLPPGQGLLTALKADALSLAAWQLGMYGWMAMVIFQWFGEIPKARPAFWFLMQIAMMCGFLTSYPANWWLLRKGVKELM